LSQNAETENGSRSPGHLIAAHLYVASWQLTCDEVLRSKVNKQVR